MGVVNVHLPQGLAGEILAAIQFPLELFIPGRVNQLPNSTGATAASTQIDVENSSIELKPGRARRPASADASSALEGVIVDLLAVAVEDPSSLDRVEADDAAAIRALVARIPREVRGRDDIRSALKSATDAEFRALISSFSLWWETEWTKVWINQRPSVDVNVPIIASGIDASVQIRGRMCIGVPILGTACTKRFSSPVVNLKGRNFFLDPKDAPPRLIASGRFDDIDIEICVHIINWDLCVRIGVTGLVNGALSGSSWVLLDFGSLEGDVPYSQQKVRIAHVIPAPGSGGMDVAVELSVGP